MIKTVNKSTLIVIAVTMVVACVLPFVLPLTNYWMCILISFCYFTILTSSLNLLLGYTGQVSLGHASFMAIGAYSYSIFAKNFPFPGSQIVGLLLGMIIPFIFGLFIGVACSRLSAIFLAMTTGAFARALKAFLMAEKWLTGGSSGLTGIPRMTLFGMNKLPTVQYNRILYFFALAAAFVVVLLCWRLINTRTGRAFQAIRLSPIAASAMGINVTGYKLLVCGISAAIAGFAGVIYSWNMAYISPDLFDKMGVKLLTMAVIGGMGTIPGPVIGAVVMGYLPELLRFFGQYLEASYGVLIILVFLFLPKGLFGGAKSLTDYFQKKRKNTVAEAKVATGKETD